MKPTKKPMKRLSLYLFLILFTFQTLSQADDIRDFEIEGMSVGDSLLDYFSEEEIKKNKQYEFNYNDIFATIGFIKNSFKVYDKVQFHYKLKDKNYKIYGMIGVIEFKNNIKDCFNKKDKIVAELSDELKDVKKQIYGEREHSADKSGNSKTYDVYFKFESGNYIAVSCYDWTKEMGYSDNLKVAIQSNEFENFLKKYYK